jgi:hypothetical protein
MRLKTLAVLAVAAAFAVPLSTQAQSDKPASGSSAKDVPAKCAALTGADREKCVQEERAGSGGSGSSPTSPSTGSGSTSGSGSAAPKK